MPYEPIHHKYRPQTFKDLVGQETIALTLNNALKQEKIAPAYLFTGPRGTGKTSSARILAKSLNCLNADRPTPEPCGKCEACRAIASGSALDVMEIDAASNTGVDNIREIIERSRFAPVQCRYKIYAIDECLTGDTLIQTAEGLMRIDNPSLKGRQVLSYNEKTKSWEYKKVLRWLNRGSKKTLIIKTKNNQISCTENHLIRTETGWIEAKNVKEGMKILSPVNVDAEVSSTNMVRTEENADLQGDINLGETNTAANLTISKKFSDKQEQYSLSVNVDAEKNSRFPNFCSKKAKESKVFNLTGSDIHIEKDTDFGNCEEKNTLILFQNSNSSNLGLYTEHCWEMGASNIRTHTVDFPDYAGLTGLNSVNGWNIKRLVYKHYVHRQKMLSIEDMVKNQQFAIQPAILSYERFLKWFDLKEWANQSPWSGSGLLAQRDWHGGTWMMALCNFLQQVIPQYFYTLKDFLKRKTKLLPVGLQIWDILQTLNPIQEDLLRKCTTTSNWEQNPVVNGCQIYKNIQFPQWTTNSVRVESVSQGSCEKVYDLEVEDNHNFVANGLLVHNCHMLSTAAFNALLKTLEEPPPQVVFILATTDPQRVLSTIISRCQRFDYRRIPLPAMVGHLKYIAGEEKIAIADDALTLIAQIANGGLRDAESLLDQLSLFPDEISVEKVWDLVGAVPEQDLLKLLRAINRDDSLGVLEQCRSLLDRGREPIVVLQNLASFYLNLLIAKTAPQRPDMVAVTETCWQQLCEEANNWDTSLIMRGQQQLKSAETQLKRTTQPRLWLEVTLLGLLPQANLNVASTSSSPPKIAVPPTVSDSIETGKVNVKPPTSKTSVVALDKKLDTPYPAPPIEREKLIEKATRADHPISNTSAPVQESAASTTTPTIKPAIPTPKPEPKPAPTTVSSAETTAENVDLEEIWLKVLNCLQPPPTQALLKQQCHLISFYGSSAIVGISSATLQKLYQHKVPNIEQAFSLVVQHKVKVQLEVASKPQNLVKKNPITIHEPPKELKGKPVKPVANTPDSASNNVSSHRQSDRHNFAIPVPDSTPPRQPDLAQTNRANPDGDRSTSAAIASNVSVVAADSSTVPITPKSAENPAIVPPIPTVQVQPSLDEAYEDSDLDKAIASLTQSFEGELVEMENSLDNALEIGETSNLKTSVEASSSLEPNKKDISDR